jgi:hypothetical protein
MSIVNSVIGSIQSMRDKLEEEAQKKKELSQGISQGVSQGIVSNVLNKANSILGSVKSVTQPVQPIQPTITAPQVKMSTIAPREAQVTQFQMTPSGLPSTKALVENITFKPIQNKETLVDKLSVEFQKVMASFSYGVGKAIYDPIAKGLNEYKPLMPETIQKKTGITVGTQKLPTTEEIIPPEKVEYPIISDVGYGVTQLLPMLLTFPKLIKGIQGTNFIKNLATTSPRLSRSLLYFSSLAKSLVSRECKTSSVIIELSFMSLPSYLEHTYNINRKLI